ncbi:MAG: GMC family oxidoreductase, partial [Cyclobacteriaceae bacterium]|nr:GMC family oxidoreductase [Cyclobacteriaceae bacterium]
MANLAIDAIKNITYDAIVIGSGISGGWAAKELTQQGLKTLVLERGRDVKHIIDYPTANMHPWEFEHRGQMPLTERMENPVASRSSIFSEATQHFAVRDAEHPYIQEKPFNWIRGYHVGGRSLLWARQTQRWSDFDFEGPARDGFAVDWPIRYQDIAPWYSHVEKFAGVSGNKDGLPHLPDGEFLPPTGISCIETYFQEQVAKFYTDRQIIQGRCAHITDPQQIHIDQNRSKCLNRKLCSRGCPLGGYFSSNASTLPTAMKTGNMELRPHSVVHSIIYDEQKEKAVGVRVIDGQTKEMHEFYASIIFVNASALNSNLILLHSTSGRFPHGLGNDNGLLGKYISWHNYRGRVSARYEGLQGKKVEGQVPNYGYLPRFRNVLKQETNFLRGYAAGVAGGRGMSRDSSGLGASLKDNLLHPTLSDQWGITAWMMGECVPLEQNQVTLDAEKVDPFGIPQLRISADWAENDDKMVKDFEEQLTEMFEKAGFTNIEARDSHSAPGSDIHEMGG